ncbi:amino acid aminotransferase [Ferrimonas gelatinilytica]|uniref:Aminotransferase n=1 Tax=Ferrimonas gelatinilytica TaxID=1255257 RepID=A0ABP9RXC7_9GAMM
MFEKIELAPADPILGLNEAFRADPREGKVNLGVGVYKDEVGDTPVLHCVKQAEARLLADEQTKSYLGIDGHAQFRSLVQPLLLGADHAVLIEGRARTVQAPGGTGALRIAGDFVKGNTEVRRVWISNPSWANHRQIFEVCGFEVREYRYYDKAERALDFDGMLADLDTLGPEDLVVLHGCCHNPTGIDPSGSQWDRLAQSAKARGWLPLFDFAYQGFATDVEQDAAGLRQFAAQLDELLIANSFSKNFGLYNERIGAMTVIAGDGASADRALSQVKRVVRANYSNPPSHGAAVVATILGDTALKALWLEELGQMRERIHAMRHAFVAGLATEGVAGDFSFIERQNGMFSFSGLSPVQVKAMQEEFGIYIVGSGRINVAGLTEQNLPLIIKAIAAVS